MLNYELAKQLYDSGFTGNQCVPKSDARLCKYGKENCPHKDEKGRHKWMHDCEGISNPTLTELIEAMPKEVLSENKNTGKGIVGHALKIGFSDQSPVGEKDNWYATYEFYESTAEKNNIVLFGSGETPSDAVAHLYLALNQKP